MQRHHVLAKCAVIAALSMLAESVIARECTPDTRKKASLIEASQGDKETLCAAMSMVSPADEASFRTQDFARVIDAAQRLRDAGYKSRTTIIELVAVAGIRPSSELELVANSYARTGGCLTPAMVVRDMANAVEANGREASQMFRRWNRDGFLTYLALIANGNSCTFR